MNKNNLIAWYHAFLELALSFASLTIGGGGGGDDDDDNNNINNNELFKASSGADEGFWGGSLEITQYMEREFYFAIL